MLLMHLPYLLARKIVWSELNELNAVSNLEFTMEEENEDQLPFLDVMIKRDFDGFTTTVYRKPTFSGTYQKWNSFAPKSRKINLLGLIVHRALNICSTSTLSEELANIKTIFKNSGYPGYIVERTVKNKLANSAKGVMFGPSRQPVYLCLPYKGIASERITQNLRSAVQSTYGAVQLRTIFRTSQMLPNAYKDTLPKFQKSNIVYMFKCNRCDCEYVGKTSRRLVDRIEEHVPSAIRKRANDQTQEQNNPDVPVLLQRYNLRSRNQPNQVSSHSQPSITPSNISAVKLHLFENPECARTYTRDCFKVIGQARTSFQLSVLEAVLINSHKPILCRQKDFVYHCKLFRNYISS